MKTNDEEKYFRHSVAVDGAQSVYCYTGGGIGGAITGVGTHDELLANNREYQEIYHSQVRGDAPAAMSGKEAE